ncbi:hypothetical protein, partial [Collinsella aerofaciens]|uniref:hypothetical protein n=1 Tax=Collinsella aerofaciens TaxID=74426 RepID=UPI00232C8C30
NFTTINKGARPQRAGAFFHAQIRKAAGQAAFFVAQKGTGFCIFRQTTLYEQLISVCPDYAKCTASRYISIPLYKNLYFCDCA